jgi:hypothetical protein
LAHVVAEQPKVDARCTQVDVGMVPGGLGEISYSPNEHGTTEVRTGIEPRVGTRVQGPPVPGAAGFLELLRGQDRHNSSCHRAPRSPRTRPIHRFTR